MNLFHQVRVEAYHRALERAGYCHDSAAMIMTTDRDWLEGRAATDDVIDVHAVLKQLDITPTMDASKAFAAGYERGSQEQ